MNVNLDRAISREGAQPRLTDVDTIGAMIRDSAEILAQHEDTRPWGPPALIPEGPDYPGSYQVWFPVRTDDSDWQWLYIDSEGMAIRADHLPDASTMGSSDV